MDFRKEASAYIALGFKVFPLRPWSKEPATGHGVYDATDDMAKIEQWAEEIPGANVAGACALATEAGPGSCVVTILPDRGDRYFKPLAWEKTHSW